MELKDIKQIAVIGAGSMGSGIALEFARFGYYVNLYDISNTTLQNAMMQIDKDLSLMAELNLVTGVEVEQARKCLLPVADFTAAVLKADYVIEAISEILALKQDLFTRLGNICHPDTILASNSSGLTPSEMANQTRNPERVLVTHYYSPPHFMPLVEIFGNEQTDLNVIGNVVQLMRKMRKKPVITGNEVLKQAGNRLQSALRIEAQKLVDEGMTPQTVDDIITFGFGRRLPFQGYFKRLDLVGLNANLNRYLASGSKPWPTLVAKIENGETGAEAGKGFYEWPGDSPNWESQRLKVELARLLKADMDSGLI